MHIEYFSPKTIPCKGLFLKGLFILLFFICFRSFGQNSDSITVYRMARADLDTLTSQGYHGRGYVNRGDRKAADYLARRFHDLQLLSFGKDYFQPFTIQVNTFPGKMEVWLDDTKLVPGVDYIAHEASGSGKGSFALNDHSQPSRQTLVRPISERNKPVINPDHLPMVFLEPKKLTADFSTTAWKFPAFILLKSTRTDTAHAIRLEIENKLLKKYQTQNVLGYIKGSVFPDSFLVFTAHYDHLGQLGANTYFPGANDNASGTSMLLSLADYYSRPENRPRYSILFIAFSAEEVGLLGSKYFTEHPVVPLKQIKFLLNMDIFGTGEEGITVVNGSVFPVEFELLKKINAENGWLKEVKVRGKAANSDHFFFSEKGVKAFFIYTMGGIKAYHDVEDRSETLPLNEFVDLKHLIIKFASVLQQ